MPKAPSKAPSTPSLRELVQAARAIGRQRAAFLSDWRNRHLTMEGWITEAVRLSGLDPVELVELRARLEVECPRLFALCRRIADDWSRSTARDGLPPTDRPAPHGALDGDQREPGAWMGRRLVGISVEAASAVAGVLVAESGRDVWGRAEHPDEADERLGSWASALAELQARMAVTPPTWADLEEDQGGTVLVAGVPLLPADDLAVRAADAGAGTPVLQRAA